MQPPTGGQMISPLRQAEKLERAQGALLGQLVSDALGSLVDFRTLEQTLSSILSNIILRPFEYLIWINSRG